MLVTIISAVHSLRMDFIKEYYTSSMKLKILL